jgi:hypothetical protein
MNMHNPEFWVGPFPLKRATQQDQLPPKLTTMKQIVLQEAPQKM